MERRNFIKTAVLGAVAGAVTLNTSSLIAGEKPENNVVDKNKPVDLVAAMGWEPEELYSKAISQMGGMSRFIKKGQKVVVKPNIGWDKKPEFAANVNPLLVAAIVKDCLKAGASEVVVFDHSCDECEASYRSSGIEEAAKKAGARVAFAHDEKYYKEVSIPDGIKLQKAKIHEALLACDAWINVPILKNHGGAKMTCAMKNYMGIVWDRGYFHTHNLQQSIADIATYVKRPVLNIVDAYRIMTQNGPKGKTLDDVQTPKAIFMSTDIVAVDTAACKFLGQFNEKVNMDVVSHIKLGEEHHLGTTNLDAINVVKLAK
ncbi:MAG: DUF362 domain-containing protein [Bacteroidales bacterium]|nr:DUF362 domain-containing protein [Bacteroidales bacterium]MDD4670183.1 DUF362 domain-containing protein [Bacteroidales bacterium]